MSIGNKKRYFIKERLARKFDRDFSEMDNSPELSESEINEIVEEITNLKELVTLRPFDKDIIPLGKNDDSTKNLFHRRKYYKDYALPDTTKNLNEVDGQTIDDDSNYQGTARNLIPPFNMINFVDQKMYYGRINTKNRSIYPSEKFLSLVAGTDDIFLIDFVAEAANEMISKINRMVETGKIKNQSIYANFKPKKGWESFNKKHHGFMNSIFKIFIQRYATSQKFFTKITDFNSFVIHLTAFLDVFLPKFPMTRSSAQLASNVSPNISGLVFDLSLDDHGNDENKYRAYILDKHFVDINIIANGFGFMIDKNAPWRFVADLESPQMKDRMSQRGYNTLQEMFDAYYYDAHLYEINSLREYIMSFYDSYVEAYPYYTVVEDCNGRAKAKLLYRQKNNQKTLSDKKMLELYFYIKASEASLDLNQERFDNLVDEAHEIFKAYGFVQALHFISDKTTQIVGGGENYGQKINKSNRIFHNPQTYYKRSSFKFKL